MHIWQCTSERKRIDTGNRSDIHEAAIMSFSLLMWFVVAGLASSNRVGPSVHKGEAAFKPLLPYLFEDILTFSKLEPASSSYQQQ